MDSKKAKEILIKAGLSERKAKGLSDSLAKFYNEENDKKANIEEKEIAEVVTKTDRLKKSF